jgi:glutamine amidotransferase
MIGIIDYRMGNLRSVQKAFEHVGAHADIVRAPEQIDKLDKLMLPGVGAFADGMMMLREMGYIEPLRAFVASGKPFMGICLGMQLLFDGSQEDAPSADQPVPGLGLVAGDVVQFTQPAEGERIKIPHMGWNTLQFAGDMPLFAGVAEGSACYFVHGYYCRPANPADIAATTQYPMGRPFASAVRRDNIFATQFHPEKSQRVGLKILENFAKLS